MNWEKTNIDLGVLTSGKKVTVTFNAAKKLNVVSTQSGCGCSKPTWDNKEQKLVVEFTPGKVPIHLKNKGEYTTTKIITVRYTDGTQENLSFTALIKKR